MNKKKIKFQSCGETKLGIYPIVNKAYMLEELYELGITTAQLRIKDLKNINLENEIKLAVDISKKYNARFFLNDYWELAIKYNAYGVHLGQEDIQDANISKILNANLRLGISTHNLDEIDFALSFEPSYLAIGPIYETKTKKLSYETIGINKLKQYSKKVNYPIVAIGGININNIKNIIKENCVSGIALISDILINNEISEDKIKECIFIFNK